MPASETLQDILADKISSREQALNSLTVYQDPSSSQSIVQPAGTVLSLQGTVDVTTPRSIAGVRYADQFPGADIGEKINAAIAALNADGPADTKTGGTIIIPRRPKSPDGTYSAWQFTHPIVLDARYGIILRGLGTATGGAGQASDLVYSGPCGTSPISALSSAGIRITGLSLTTTSNCPGTPLIDFRHTTDPAKFACQAAGGALVACDSSLGVVDECILSGPASATAINVHQAIEMTIRGNNIANVGIGIQGRAPGVGLDKYSNSIRIENNQFYRIGTTPIRNGGQAWVVQGNTFEQLADNSAGAFSCEPGAGAEGISFIGNWFGDAASTGTWIDWAGGGLIVQGNYFGNAATAVRVGGSSAQISGNTFASTAGATVDVRGSSVQISGNTFSSTVGATVNLSSAGPQITVSNNVFAGSIPIGRSTTVPMSRTTITANAGAGEYVAEATPIINVRNIVTKTIANGLCPAPSTAIYAPRSYAGLTGAAICAANVQASKTCVTEKFVYVTADNHYGTYPASDLPCSSAVNYPWPWGYDYTSPSTLDGEWSHGDTFIVCCR